MHSATAPIISDRDDKRLLTKANGQSGWIYRSEIESMPEKAETILREMRHLLDFTYTDTQEKQGQRLKKLDRWTGQDFASLDQARAWDKEYGDYLIWSQVDDQVQVDLGRQQRREPIAADGIRVLVRGLETWAINTSYVVRIVIENVSHQNRYIKTNRFHIELTIAPYGIRGRRGRYESLHPEDDSLTLLSPGESTVVNMRLSDVGPGPYTIVARVRSPTDGDWKGEAKSSRLFVDVEAVLEADDPQ